MQNTALNLNFVTPHINSLCTSVAQPVKNLSAMQETPVQSGVNQGSGRSPGEGIGYPPQYSHLENSMDRGAWQATVHGVAKSDTTKQLSLSPYKRLQFCFVSITILLKWCLCSDLDILKYCAHILEN